MEPDLTHVGDIKQTCLVSGMEVLLDNTARVLNGHRITGKRNHFSTQLPVERVERGGFEGGRSIHTGNIMSRKAFVKLIVKIILFIV
jgi:hypothetical protein